MFPVFLCILWQFHTTKGSVGWVLAAVAGGSSENVELCGGSEPREPEREALSPRGQGRGGRKGSLMSSQCVRMSGDGLPRFRISVCRGPRWETHTLGTAGVWVWGRGGEKEREGDARRGQRVREGGRGAGLWGGSPLCLPPQASRSISFSRLGLAQLFRSPCPGQSPARSRPSGCVDASLSRLCTRACGGGWGHGRRGEQGSEVRPS